MNKKGKVKEVRLDANSVRAPGDLRARMARSDVAELAESIQSHGLLHPITVDANTGRIVAGRDRYSAHVLLKAEKIPVQFIEVKSEHEFKLLEIVENLRRRHEPEVQRALIKQYIAVCEAEAEGVEIGEQGVKRRPGRPRTAKGEALRRVAEITGQKSQTIARALRRDAEQRAGTQKAQQEASESPPVETWGLNVDPGYLVQVGEVVAMMDALKSQIQSTRRKLTVLEGRGTPMTNSSKENFRTGMTHMYNNLSKLTPVAVCPSCKLVETLLPDCVMCGGSGYVGQRKLEEAPPELKSQSPRMVEVGAIGGEGAFLLYDEMFEDAAEISRASDVETLEEAGERLGVELSQDRSNGDLFEVDR